MVDEDKNTQVWSLADQLAGLVGLSQGHLEVHCHQGRASKIDVVDKSRKREGQALHAGRNPC